MLSHSKKYFFGSCLLLLACAGCNNQLQQHQQLEIKNIDPNQLRIAIEHSSSVRFSEDGPTFGLSLAGDTPPVDLHYDISLRESTQRKPTTLQKLVRSDRKLSLFQISTKNQPTLNKVLTILKDGQQRGIAGNAALNVKLDNACSTLASASEILNSEFNLSAPERVTVWIKTVKNGYYQKLLDRVDIAEQKALPSCQLIKT